MDIILVLNDISEPGEREAEEAGIRTRCVRPQSFCRLKEFEPAQTFCKTGTGETGSERPCVRGSLIAKANRGAARSFAH